MRFGAESGHAEHNGDLKILVICTGNVCRSPLAEQLLATRLTERGVMASVTSAGTGALVGESMPEQAAALSRAYGAHPEGHRAKQLTDAFLTEADLVLTAERAHRAVVVSDVPRATRYTFTLAQFARIAASLDEDDWNEIGDSSALVAAVGRNRGIAPPLDNPADDDVTDPYRQSQEVYDESGASIDRAVTAIVEAFERAQRR